MRTTITLESEAEALVHRAMRERNASFKQVVNDAIVAALTPIGEVDIELPSHSYGASSVDYDKALQLAGQLEDDELLRKMSMGK